MKAIRFITAVSVVLLSVSCGPGNREEDQHGHSTPIDSVNDQGRAPATYHSNDPASDQDTVLENASDTGTKVNEGPKTTR